MASIRQLASGKWQVRWLDSRGEPKARSFPAGERREALKFKAEVEVIRARGEDWIEQRRDTLVDLPGLFREYARHQRTIRKLGDRTGEQLVIGLSLYVTYLRTLHPRGTLWPELLTRESVEAFFAWMQTEREWKGRRGMSEITAFQHTRKVCRAWSWLHGRHPDKVAAYVELDLPEARPALRPRRHTWEECDRVIAAATVEWHRRLFIACRFTGLRKDQVMRLQWSDFDLDRATLTIRPELGKSRAERRGRTVPIAPAFVAELATWGKREGFLIQTTGEKRWLDYKTLRKAWQRATGERPRQPFHGFRKAFEQEMRRMRVPDDVRDLLVGHAQGQRRGVETDATYLGEDPIMPDARDAVARIPAIGATREVSIKRRVTRLVRRV